MDVSEKPLIYLDWNVFNKLVIDDALHCFYGAHCNHFITLDKRCYDKAKLIYQKLNIPTQVHTPLEFCSTQLNPNLPSSVKN